MKEIRKIIAQYDRIDHEKEKVALASVVHLEASGYRRIGARMLVQSSGIWIGGISGGCLEGDALRRSQNAIFKNEPSTVVYDTMDDDKNQIGVGLGCNGRIEVLFNPIDTNDPHNEIEVLRSIQSTTAPRILLKIVSHPNKDHIGKVSLLEANEQSAIAGLDQNEINDFVKEVEGKNKPKLFKAKYDGSGEVSVLLEFIRPETHLVVAGDNYDILAMLGLANELGWRVTVLGKAKKLSKHVYEQAETVLDYGEAPNININAYTAVVLMTHDYKHDLNLLNHFITTQPAYLGILGPKKRFQKIQDELNLNLEQIGFIHSPTGLEIGAESPEEIALSICAEIMAVLRNKKGGSLHFKKGPIHERD